MTTPNTFQRPAEAELLDRAAQAERFAEYLRAAVAVGDYGRAGAFAMCLAEVAETARALAETAGGHGAVVGAAVVVVGGRECSEVRHAVSSRLLGYVAPRLGADADGSPNPSWFYLAGDGPETRAEWMFGGATAADAVRVLVAELGAGAITAQVERVEQLAPGGRYEVAASPCGVTVGGRASYEVRAALTGRLLGYVAPVADEAGGETWLYRAASAPAGSWVQGARSKAAAAHALASWAGAA